MEQEKKVILLAGPTASGKSKLAIKLAQYFDGEIINADSMQIYKEISILTSKPNSQDIKAIKHHLYGFNSVKKKFSTGHWLKLVVKKIEEQWENERMPIVVGGTGLYFKALTDGLVKIPDIPNKTRTQIRKLHKKIGQKKFFTQLIKLDPLAKRLVLPSDTQRSMRAYEVKKFTNKSLFEFLKETKSNFNNNVFKKLFINTPRELLHKKIEKRVEKMFNDGAVDEVKKFLEQYKIAFKENFSLVRGLDYYCHTVFEFKSDSLGSQDTIIGGGRYDGLIETLGGQNIPGVGWAGGVERIMMLMQDKTNKNEAIHFSILNQKFKLYALEAYKLLTDNKIPVYWNFKYN